MSDPTKLQMLIERDLAAKKLGSLDDFVASRRATESWRAIAAELSEVTGREVSSEAVRRWYGDRLHIQVRVA